MYIPICTIFGIRLNDTLSKRVNKMHLLLFCVNVSKLLIDTPACASNIFPVANSGRRLTSVLFA